MTNDLPPFDSEFRHMRLPRQPRVGNGIREVGRVSQTHRPDGKAFDPYIHMLLL